MGTFRGKILHLRGSIYLKSLTSKKRKSWGGSRIPKTCRGAGGRKGGVGDKVARAWGGAGRSGGVRNSCGGRWWGRLGKAMSFRSRVLKGLGQSKARGKSKWEGCVKGVKMVRHPSSRENELTPRVSEMMAWEGGGCAAKGSAITRAVEMLFASW